MGKDNNIHRTLFLIFPIVLGTLLSLSMNSCAEDNEKEMLPYITELVEVSTGHDGIVMSIQTDDGINHQVSHVIKAEVADTVFRCVCTYTTENNQATIYSLTHIFSQPAYPFSQYKQPAVEPVKFISCWKTDKYMNLRIGVMTGDVGRHQFGFVEDSILNTATGKKAYFTLLHRRPENDPESYTSEAFLSMPVQQYGDCDSLVFFLHTYDGIVRVAR